MKKKVIVLLWAVILCCTLAAGCGKKNTLADGTYTADFNTDSSMFHVNEAYDGKGILTVENGQMTIHVSMPSKNIVNLYLGSAEDAQKDGAELIQPVTDTVTYSDGTTEEVNGFDVPVPVIDEEFDLALIGKKGVWYDHKVSVSNPVAVEETESKIKTVDKQQIKADNNKDGAAGNVSFCSSPFLVIGDFAAEFIKS